MKKLCITLALFIASFSCFANPVQFSLNENWTFRQVGTDHWLKASVPGTVHTDLMANGIIENPYWGENEKDAQWIDKVDWEYITTFQLGEEETSHGHADLVMQGLDTYADVYFNGHLVLAADNMFRQWRVNVGQWLKKGNNELRVYFHSPVKVDLPKCKASPYPLEASNDQSQRGGLGNDRISIYARKAGYHYGWDWGPRLVTSGIWRPIYLEFWDAGRISDTYYRQVEVTADIASIIDSVEIVSAQPVANATVNVLVKNPWNEPAGVFSTQVSLQAGVNHIAVPVTVIDPVRWWPNGMHTHDGVARPFRYEFTTELNIGDKTVDEQKKLVGLRSMRVISKPDSIGDAFYVEVNGEPVFCKGANYIPQDIFLPRVTTGQYERTIRDAVDVNMNMLRVWGGGIYEDDRFYDLCDQYGIMVWQDFMFACSLYPAEGKLLESIKAEAMDNVKRLRNHACLALWAGNNECNDAWLTWGWKEQYEKQNKVFADHLWEVQLNLYENVLKDIVHAYAPDIFYWPASPYSPSGKTRETTSGDNHYWLVWHGKEPITEYNKARSRFFSEYGFQSFPEMATIISYAPDPATHDIHSSVMMAHQRGGEHANDLINHYLLQSYNQPDDFQEFVYMTQVLQGDAIKTAMEAHRRMMPYCMGSLVWQHDDCWPVASWSSRDCYGRWKAQHYFTRAAFSDVLVSPVVNGDSLDVYIVNDRRRALCSPTLVVTSLTLSGDTLATMTIDQNYFPGLTSEKIISLGTSDLLQGRQAGDVIVTTALTTSGKTYRNIAYLTSQKDMHYGRPTISCRTDPQPWGAVVTLHSDTFARAVRVTCDDPDARYSDNYFDLLPNQPVSINIHSAKPVAGISLQTLK